MADVCEDWVTRDNLCPPCDSDELDPDNLDRAIAVASNVLWKQSARRYPGHCSETVRPCAARVGRVTYPRIETRSRGTEEFGAPVVSCGCNSADDCACSSIPEVRLPRGPVVSVDSVRVDGALVDGADYRVDDGRKLVRVDGDPWPCCQDMLADPETDDDTFQVTYTYGRRPPEDGKLAAAVLACEIALACDPSRSRECRLPKRVQQVTRQGVTLALLDPTDFFEGGNTGLYEVDLFLRSENPAGISRRARILSPDVPTRVRRTGTT